MAPKKVINEAAKSKQLADPWVGQPSQIPLLGANILLEIFTEGVEKYDGLLFQNTKLSLIISGKVDDKAPKVVSTHLALAEFENQMLNF